LAKNFNKGIQSNPKKPFVYKHLIQMSAIGSGDALIDPVVLAGTKSSEATVIKGWKGKLIWMSAYWGF